MFEWIKGLDPLVAAAFWGVVGLVGLSVFLALLLVVIRKSLKVNDNEGRLSKMDRQITAIESCVCSMGGLSERLIEIERRTMSQGKMLSTLTSHLKEIIDDEEKG